MKVLITGATGFVGRAIARSLLKHGASLHILARDPQRLGPHLDAAVVHLGDLSDPQKIAVAATGCAFVVHAASESNLRSDERVLKWVNIAGTENVLNAARYAGCRRVVYISCADVTLANCDRLHWNEDRRPDRTLMDAHARSKQLAEELALASSTSKMEVVALRPAWLWGPGDTSVLPGLCKEAVTMRGIALCGRGRNYLATTHIELLTDAVRASLGNTDVAGKSYYVTDLTQGSSEEFFNALSTTLGLPMPRKSYAFKELLWARYRQRYGKPGLLPSEVVKRSRSSLFDVQRAVKDLGITPIQTWDKGMQELKHWVAENGGINGMLRLLRLPKAASTVDSHVEVAGGDVRLI